MQDRNYRRVGQGDYKINFGAQFLALKMKQKISRNLKKKQKLYIRPIIILFYYLLFNI